MKLEERKMDPPDGAYNITGYRIYYGNQQNLLVPLYVTRIVLNSSSAAEKGGVWFTRLNKDILLLVLKGG